MFELLNAIYPPVFIIIVAFFCSFLLYTYIKLISEGVSKKNSFIAVCLYFFFPLTFLYLLPKYLFTGKLDQSKSNDSDEESFFLRLLIVMLFLPTIFFFLLIHPSRSANGLVNRTIAVLEPKEDKMPTTNQESDSELLLIKAYEQKEVRNKPSIVMSFVQVFLSYNIPRKIKSRFTH